MHEKRRQIAVYLDPEASEALLGIQARTGENVSEVVRRTLKQEVARPVLGGFVVMRKEDRICWFVSCGDLVEILEPGLPIQTVPLSDAKAFQKVRTQNGWTRG